VSTLTTAQTRDLKVFARKASWAAAKTAANLETKGFIERCGGFNVTVDRPRRHVRWIPEYRITEKGREALARRSA